MQVELNNTARKQYRRLNEPHKGRIAEALDLLENEPPEGDIKKLQGRDGYRVVVGDYRILFDIDTGNDRIDVFKIAPRGQAYKKGK
jgi:mRNA interferase RelE/StbE